MRRLFVLALLAACVACGNAAPSPVAGPSDGPGQPASSSSKAPSDPGNTARSSGSAVASLPSDVSTGSAPQAQKTKHPIKLLVTLDRTCLRPGERIEIVAVTEKAAQVGFTAYYPANNNYVPDLFYVPREGNVTGTVIWNLVLRPDTPLGEAQLFVGATKSPKSGMYQGVFTVANAC